MIFVRTWLAFDDGDRCDAQRHSLEDARLEYALGIQQWDSSPLELKSLSQDLARQCATEARLLLIEELKRPKSNCGLKIAGGHEIVDSKG